MAARAVGADRAAARLPVALAARRDSRAAAISAACVGLRLSAAMAGPAFAFALVSLCPVLVNLYPPPADGSDGALLQF